MGFYGTTVPEPQNVSSIATWIPDNQTNPGSTSCLQAWGFLRQFVGEVVPKAWNDLLNLPIQ